MGDRRALLGRAGGAATLAAGAASLSAGLATPAIAQTAQPTLRWRLTFGLDPHNSYIGGFANGGWLGGFAFLGLALATGYVGFRLCLSPSPVQRQAQIVWPALFIFFLQAFQIDIDHWRHVYMMMGMVWALEAARLREGAAA